MVPQPVMAMLLLFPITKESEAAKDAGEPQAFKLHKPFHNTCADSSTKAPLGCSLWCMPQVSICESPCLQRMQG